MKCPVCQKRVENFREHALNHIRADEAYGVETWDRATARSWNFTPISRRLIGAFEKT